MHLRSFTGYRLMYLRIIFVDMDVIYKVAKSDLLPFPIIVYLLKFIFRRLSPNLTLWFLIY